ncbi:MAG: transaldolase [Spirochaetaceae bacterium]|nr:MAG: transaldolase [Spirochaetaceae bacterium]
MADTTSTDYWSDTCNTEHLEYALAHGATGATTNPTIVHAVLRQQIGLWDRRIARVVGQMPAASETEIAWKLIEEVAQAGAAMLKPAYDSHKGKKGRIAIQVNPRNFRNSEAMVRQAVHFHALADNVTVKFPATAAGIAAVEEATYQGVSITATVSFSVSQVIAAAEAVERGLERRLGEGKPIDRICPNCVVMVGRVDDWLKVVAEKEDIIVEPECLEWAGVAVLKRAYRIFQERGFRSRLMAAAYRNHYHWSEFIGGDLITTIPYNWALRFNASDVEVRQRIDNPVPDRFLDRLQSHFADFRRAWEPQGLAIGEFDSYGAVARTLRSFTASYDELVAMIRDYVVPDPDR